MKKELTKIIFEYLCVRSVVTMEELWKAFRYVGPNWEKLTRYCELRTIGLSRDTMIEKLKTGGI